MENLSAKGACLSLHPHEFPHCHLSSFPPILVTSPHPLTVRGFVCVRQ